MIPVVTVCLLIAFAPAFAGEPFIVAHRGASHDAPENTLPAFHLAWEQGADAIEADFHLTSDGSIVCIHDNDTAGVTGSKRIQGRMSVTASQTPTPLL